nr:hypothetical protein [Helicobacter pylori]
MTELQKQANELKNSQQVLENEKTELLREKENLTKANTELKTENQKLTTEKENLTKEKTELTDKNKTLSTEKTELTDKITELQKQIKSLRQSQQVLENEKNELLKEKDNLTKANADLTEKSQKLTTEKENLTTDLSNAKNQVIQANQEKDKLEQKYAPYKKLERLYEVFLEVKGCLNFNFVPQTHSAMDLIASVLSDSKYYLESLYNKASQELSDKRSDKGEKLAELFDLLFEYVKDNKFERLKEPSAYDSTCKKLYPEQNTSGKIQRVVLIGYTYDKKTTYYTIVDMGS